MTPSAAIYTPAMPRPMSPEKWARCSKNSA